MFDHFILFFISNWNFPCCTLCLLPLLLLLHFSEKSPALPALYLPIGSCTQQQELNKTQLSESLLLVHMQYLPEQFGGPSSDSLWYIYTFPVLDYPKLDRSAYQRGNITPLDLLATLLLRNTASVQFSSTSRGAH